VLARYLARHNARFAVPAAEELPAWRPWTLSWPVEAELCFHYPRRVAHDATLDWDGHSLALPRRADGRAWGRRPMTVEEHLDGSLWVRAGDERHRLREAPPSAPLLRARQLRRLDALETPAEPSHPSTEARAPSATSAASPWRPAADHPWRR